MLRWIRMVFDFPLGRNPTLCFDCGADLIASDDESMVCIQCGGRNRRITHRRGHS